MTNTQVVQNKQKRASRQADRKTATPVLDAVAQAFGITADMLMLRTNEHHIARPRQIACWILLRRGWGLSRIGRLFGVSHTTVLYAQGRVQIQYDCNPEMRAAIDRLEAHGAEKQQEIENARALAVSARALTGESVLALFRQIDTRIAAIECALAGRAS